MRRLPAWTGRLAACSGLLTCGCDKADGHRIGAHPAPSAATSSEVQALEVGQAFENRAVRIRLVTQRECGGERSVPSHDDYRLWAAEFEITNRSAYPLPVSAFHVQLRDDGNFTYTTSLAGCPTVLDARLLRYNETVRGFVPFQIPKSLQTGTLSYRFTPHGQAEAFARFHVEF